MAPALQNIYFLHRLLVYSYVFVRVCVWIVVNPENAIFPLSACFDRFVSVSSQMCTGLQRLVVNGWYPFRERVH